MGSWAKKLFGRERCGRVGIILAGTNTREFERQVMQRFDKVLSAVDAVYHGYLAKKGKTTYPVVFNVYGAPALVDVLAGMHDGGCRNVIFIGYAYGGFENLAVGTVVLPTRAYHFDGIYHRIKPDKKAGYPDNKLRQVTEEILQARKMPYVNGVNISVPAVTLQPRHANKEYDRLKPVTLEMELAACYSRAKEIGMRTTGILIVSDNRTSSIGGEVPRQLRREAKAQVLDAIIPHLRKFNLLPLSGSERFSIDKELGAIIKHPKHQANVYENC